MSRNIFIVLASLVSLLAFNIAQATLPEVIEFESKTGSVRFSHAHHAGIEEISCGDCHHMGMDKSCHDCHKQGATGSLLNAREALHRQCMGCHKEDQQAGKPTGPVNKCKGCHQVSTP